MKLTIFFLIVCCVHVTAKTSAQRVSLDEQHAPIKKILKQISRQTGFVFFYADDLQLQKIKVSVVTHNTTLDEAIGLVLKDQPLSWSRVDKTIVITRKPPAKQATPVTAQTAAPAPANDVKGTVRNENNEPLAGATISVKGKNIVTATNEKGEFVLKGAEASDSIEISMVGYAAQTLLIGDRSVIQIRLTQNYRMEEVVVVGYGTKRKPFLTGAVSTVNSEVFQSRPVINALAALQGAVPGTFIERYSGQPGSEDFNLNVRGASSINGAGSPLVLIDGIEGNLYLLNPADIESISVLKDAQASIYGARAAGGVLLVTTKKGKGGKAQIAYSNNFAVTKMTGMMISPTNYEMAVMDNEANIHNGAAPMYTPDMLQKILNNDPNPIPHPLYGGWMLFFNNTNWIDALLENGFQQKHNISISGSNPNSSYYLSGSFADHRGVVRYANDNNKLYNLRLNYDYNLTKWLKLESKVSLDHQRRTDIAGVGDWVIGEGIFGMPNHPVYTSDGKFFAQGGWSNALAFAKEAPTSNFNTRNLNTNFRLIADIAYGLKLNLQAGIMNTAKNSTDMGKPVPLYQWDGSLAYYSIANPGQSWIEEQNSRANYQNYNGFLQYNRKIGGRHDIDFMIGASYEKGEFKSTAARKYNIVSDEVWDINLGAGDMYSGGGANHWAIGSYFSRIGYIYNDKYIIEANARYDGSSRFQLADNRWGLFPGVSAGWRISKERFFRTVSFVNELKLRASYGTTGNQEGIGLYDFIQKINLGGVYPFGAGRQDPAASLAGMVAYKRTWETIINKNAGLDATLFNNKLDLSFDYFIKRNKDMLIAVTYPSLLGATAPSSNAGELRTKGFEITAAWTDKIGEFQYSARVMLSDARNTLLNLGGANTYTLGLNQYREGYPIESYFAYEFDGVIRDEKELEDYKKLAGVPANIGIGDARFKDLNNDGRISLYSDQPGSDGDVQFAGTTAPRYSYGINLGGKYKGFDLSIFFQGVGKRALFRTGDYAMPWSDWWRQPPAFYYGQTWNEDRPSAPYPRLTHGDIRYWNYQASTLQQINAAYIRLKNLQIGYSLPETLIRKVSLSRARVYVSGQDIWESHHVKGGWDPESADWGGNYPFQRFYSFGLDIIF